MFKKPRDNNIRMTIPKLDSYVNSFFTLLQDANDLLKYGPKKMEAYTNRYLVPRRNLLEEYFHSGELEKISNDKNHEINQLSKTNAKKIVHLVTENEKMAGDDEELLSAIEAMRRVWEYPFFEQHYFSEQDEVISALEAITLYGYLYSLVEYDFTGPPRLRGEAIIVRQSCLKELSNFVLRIWSSDDKGLTVRSSLGHESHYHQKEREETKKAQRILGRPLRSLEDDRPRGGPNGPIYGIISWPVESGFFYGRTLQGNSSN